MATDKKGTNRTYLSLQNRQQGRVRRWGGASWSACQVGKVFRQPYARALIECVVHRVDREKRDNKQVVSYWKRISSASWKCERAASLPEK